MTTARLSVPPRSPRRHGDGVQFAVVEYRVDGKGDGRKDRGTNRRLGPETPAARGVKKSGGAAAAPEMDSKPAAEMTP